VKIRIVKRNRIQIYGDRWFLNFTVSFAFFLSLFIFIISSSSEAETYKSLTQARQAASKTTSQDALRDVLLSAVSQLPVRDGIALCQEYEAKAGQNLKAELRGILGGLYLLLGQTKEAASWYIKAASIDEKYIVEALRLSIAVGDQKSALLLLKNEAVLAESRTIFEIWLSLYDQDYASASSKARDALNIVTKPQLRKELLLLQYFADFGQFGASPSSLAKDFPNSIESDLILGKAFPSSSLILFLGFSWIKGQAPLVDYVGSSSSSSTVEEYGSTSGIQWLQVGYFSSKDNAERLSKNLTNQKFRTRIIETKNQAGELRWAVHVAVEEDWKKTQSKLKDLGYESYPIGP